MSMADAMAAARRRYRQLSPVDAARRLDDGAVILDTRCGDQRREHGMIPGSIHVPLSVLPWRADPESGYDDPRVSDGAAELVLVCQDGYSSTMAVATLLDLGHNRVTDIAGGFSAWRAAGLPVVAVSDARFPSAPERRQRSGAGNHLEAHAELPQRL